MHPVFHCSPVKKVLGKVSGAVFDISDKQPFHPSASASGEFEVEEILDHHIRGWGLSSEWGFLVKSRSYPL